MARINFTNKTDNTGGAYDNDPTQLTAANVNEIKSAVNDIAVPEKVSQLQNDSGFITSSAIAGKADKTELGNYQLKSEMNNYAQVDDIPAKTSDLTNDSGFLTSFTETDPVYAADKPKLALKSEIPSLPAVVNDSVLFYNETGTLVTITLSELKTKLDAITA